MAKAQEFEILSVQTTGPDKKKMNSLNFSWFSRYSKIRQMDVEEKVFFENSLDFYLFSDAMI